MYNKIEESIVNKMTGLDRERLIRVKRGENVAGIDILLILQILALLAQVIPVILEWWEKRKNNLVARAYIYLYVKREIIKQGKVGVSALSLSNAIYSTLEEEC